MEPFGKNLIYIIQNNYDNSRDKFCIETGLSSSQLSKIIGGKQAPKHDLIIKLLDTFNYSYLELMNGDITKQKNSSIKKPSERKFNENNPLEFSKNLNNDMRYFESLNESILMKEDRILEKIEELEDTTNIILKSIAKLLLSDDTHTERFDEVMKFLKNRVKG